MVKVMVVKLKKLEELKKEMILIILLFSLDVDDDKKWMCFNYTPIKTPREFCLVLHEQ